MERLIVVTGLSRYSKDVSVKHSTIVEFCRSLSKHVHVPCVTEFPRRYISDETEGGLIYVPEGGLIYVPSTSQKTRSDR